MNQEIELLVFKAYHGKLSREERILLTQWVAASPEHARQVVEYSVDARSIEDALKSRQVAKATGTENVLKCHGQEVTLVSYMPVIFWRAVTVLLVTTTLLGAAFWLGQNQQAQENNEHTEFGATTLVRLSDVQVMESTDLKWNRYASRDENSETIVIPASGSLYHEFKGGGFILLEGPTTYQLENDRVIRLVEGRLVAKADPLEPFSILVDDHRLTVEGAVFGVQNIDDSVASATVFEGSIEVTQDQLGDPSLGTNVDAGQVLFLRSHDDKADRLACATQADASEYARLIDSVKLRPSYLANSVQFLADAPESLLASDLADRNHVRMFCERAGVSVKASELPKIPKLQTDTGGIPADVLLDSYLVHFDPQIEGSKAGSMTTGMIIFDRPIHAVLGSSLSIRATDALFGSASTAYPRNFGSEKTVQWGIEYDRDCIKLDSDRVLLFRLIAKQELDQIRILVEARKPTQLSE